MGSDVKKTLAKNAGDDAWVRWVMQTARTWDDLAHVIKLTGIDAVDEDHKKMTLYALEINTLVTKFEEEGFSLNYIKRQNEFLEKFYNYTVRHFQREEAIMEPFGFSWFGRHKLQHADILSQMRTLIEDFNAGRATISLNFKIAVLEWVMVHINQVDFHDFSLENWRPVLGKAQKLSDVKHLIKQTGVEVLDREHLELASLALDFDLILPGLPPGTALTRDQKEKITEHFFAFSLGTQEHFAHEEKFIYDYGLQGLEKQKVQHKKFMAMVDEYEKECLAGNIDMFKQLKLKVIEWWINHINQVDYHTFGLGNWGVKMLEKARVWEDMAGFIKLIGIEEIDVYHQKMTEYALEFSNIIDKTMKKPNDPNLTQEGVAIFDKLYNCAVEHFSMEEEIVSKGYPTSLEKQQNEHKIFLAQLRTYKSDLQSGRVQLTQKMKVGILNWWVNHINITDYNTFIDNQKIKVGKPGKGINSA